MKLPLHRGFRSAFCLVLSVLLCVAISGAVMAEEVAAAESSCSMVLIYGITATLSLLLIFGYCLMIKRKELWFLLLFISVFMVNIGYFALAISKTLEEAMLANRIAYLGSVFLPLCMLVIIMNVCQLQPHRGLLGVLTAVSVGVFLLAASGGYLTWYYKDVTLKWVNGVATLEKEYGPLHKLYFAYLFAYFGMMVGAIFYSVAKKKEVVQKYAAILAVLALWNIVVWFVEQLIDWDFEFLSVSYIITELLLLVFHDLMQEHSLTGTEPDGQTEEEQADPCPELASLTDREKDVLQLLLEDKKRREIAEELFVTENTVKKHTAHIYEKLGVSSRGELIEKLKCE